MNQNRSAYRLFFVAWVVIFFLGFLRRSEMLLTPQFFAEDGTFFFKQAYEEGFFGSIVLPVSGYYLLIPRLIAAATLKFAPLQWAPFLFSAVSLLIFALSLALFVLPPFRKIILSDSRRFFVAVVSALLPYQECLGKLAYLQWYLLLMMALVSIVDPPKSFKLRLTVVAAYLIGCFSAGIQFLLLPLIFTRLVFARCRQDDSVLYWTSLCAVSALAAVVTYLSLQSTDTIHWSMFASDKRRIIAGIVHGLSYYGPVASILGESNSHPLAASSWRAIYLLAALRIAAAIFNLRNADLNRRVLILLLVFPACGFILRPQHVVDHTDPMLLHIHTRYYLISLYAGFILFFSSVASREVRQFTALLIAVTAFHLPSFNLFPHHLPLPEWSEYARQINELERGAGPANLTIPISPPGWQIELSRPQS